jgi:hypothetical protein
MYKSLLLALLVLALPLNLQADVDARAAAEQAARAEAAKAVEEALEPMQKMSFLMGHIERDAEAGDETLKPAALAVLEAQTEKEGIPALQNYVDLKATTLSEEDAATLRGGFEAMIQMYAEQQE